ncbi:MAG: helix-turn-helix domain-containing protein [Acidimicrobiia bacterium]
MPSALDLELREPPVDEAGTELRAVEATLRCLARYGYAKTTVDDIAREAGVSRATIYRVIGGKSQLFDRALIAEVMRIRDHAATIAASATTLADHVVSMLVATSRELREHAVLNALLGHEPDAIVSYVSVHGEAFVQAAINVFAPVFTRFATERDARAISEALTRISISNMGPAAQWVDLTNEEDVRQLVTGFVLPQALKGKAQ